MGSFLGCALCMGVGWAQEPLCRMGEPRSSCKISGEGCDSKPVTFDPLNLTVWKWDKATKSYGAKPMGQLEAHVAPGSQTDWQMYLHGPMFRPWREMEPDASHPPFYVQATFTNEVYRFDNLKRGVVKHNYAYSAGIHGGGWLGHERGTLLLGTSACTHPYSACFPAPYDPITKAIGLEATGLMYVIDISEILPPPEEESKDEQKQSTIVV